MFPSHDPINPTSTTGLLLRADNVLEYTSSNAQIKLLQSAEPDAGFAISTNFDVANANVIVYKIDGLEASLAASTVCDTGTSKTIAADQWAAMRIDVDAAGNLTGTWTADAASEALAITAMKALSLTQGKLPIGYITVQTASGLSWTAGTDALQGGTGGNPSADTNYYNYRATRVNILEYGLSG